MSQWNRQGFIADDESLNGTYGDDKSGSSNRSERSTGRRGQGDPSCPDASDNRYHEKQCRNNTDVAPDRVQGHRRTFNSSTASRLPSSKEEATHKVASGSKIMSFPDRTKCLGMSHLFSMSFSPTIRTLDIDTSNFPEHIVARLIHQHDDLTPLQRYIEQTNITGPWSTENPNRIPLVA